MKLLVKQYSKRMLFFFATAHKGTFTGHGGSDRNLFIIEGVTDEGGSLTFPAQDFSLPLIPSSYLEGPELSIYKTGYQSIDGGNACCFQDKDDILKWGEGGKVYKMKKVNTPDDLLNSINRAHFIAGRAYSDSNTDVCDWQKIPKFLAAIEDDVLAWKNLNDDTSHVNGIFEINGPIYYLFREGSRIEKCKDSKIVFKAYTDKLTSRATE